MIPAILTGTAFIVLFGSFTFLLVLDFVKRKRRFLLDRQVREAEFRQELLQAQLEMQELTFRTIGQEIHDNVGQILSLAKLNLNILSFEADVPPRILDVKEQVTQAAAALRHLGAGYYADKLADMGLLAAIESQLQQLERTGLFAVEFKSDEVEIEVDRIKTIFLYRMVQEALNNIIKHSGADKVSVQVFQNEKGLHISIADNGKGFAADATGFTPGIGSKSIRQRAAMIDAVVDIRSVPGGGTTVHFLCRTGRFDETIVQV